MDAASAAELLRARNRFVRQLPSGLWARIALPRAREALAAGEVPIPVLRQMARLMQNGSDAANENIPADTLAHVTRYQSGMVLRALKGLGLEEADVGADEEMTAEVVAELSQEDFDQIFAWAERNEPIDPKAETPPSETSPDTPPPIPVEG
jgi:hypothetical protein